MWSESDHWLIKVRWPTISKNMHARTLFPSFSVTVSNPRMGPHNESGVSFALAFRLPALLCLPLLEDRLWFMMEPFAWKLGLTATTISRSFIQASSQTDRLIFLGRTSSESPYLFTGLGKPAPTLVPCWSLNQCNLSTFMRNVWQAFVWFLGDLTWRSNDLF
jgi:hypothetical protein